MTISHYKVKITTDKDTYQFNVMAFNFGEAISKATNQVNDIGEAVRSLVVKKSNS